MDRSVGISQKLAVFRGNHNELPVMCLNCKIWIIISTLQRCRNWRLMEAAFSSDLTLRICSKPHTYCFCHYVIIAFAVDDAVAVGVPIMHCVCSSFRPLIHEASSSRASFTTRLIVIHLSSGIAPIKPFLTIHFPSW